MVIQTLMKNAANAQNMIKEIIKTFQDSLKTNKGSVVLFSTVLIYCTY